MSRALFPLAAAGLALTAGAVSTLYLHREAQAAVRRELDERLLAAGRTATTLVPTGGWTPEALRELMRGNALDDAYVVGEGWTVLASATGASGQRVDRLRVDRRRLERAFAGEANVGLGFELDGLEVGGGYFPLRSPGEDGAVTAVLALEAGVAFTEARRTIARARSVSLALSLVAALGLAAVAAQQARSERHRRQAAERAARAEALTRVAASAAHEVRNPLGIIRGTVELLRERSGASLGERDRRALEDILEEVQRLRQLTDDLLDLSVDRPLALGPVDLAPLLEEVAAGVEGAFPGVCVRRELASPLPPVEGDGGRLRQVFLNLLQNGAQAASAGELRLLARASGDAVEVQVHDDGPGVSPEVRARLFEPFATDRPQGTGLGLALCRRLVERHGGTIALLEEAAGAGTTFRVILPGARRAKGA